MRGRIQTAPSNASPAKAVCLAQFGIAATGALICGVLLGLPHAFAAFYGGLTAVVPTLYFAYRVFARRPDATPQEVVGAAFRGEIGKIVLTGLLFWFGVAVFAEQFLALLGTYAACLLAYWLVLARVGFTRT